jgi:uncharacterized protein
VLRALYRGMYRIVGERAEEEVVMRIALALAVCGAALAIQASAGSTGAQTVDPAQSPETLRARMNENVVTIMGGAPDGTNLAIAQDLAGALDNGHDLRVLPMVGRGSTHNVLDVLYLRGVDMGITHANVINHLAHTNAFGGNLKGRINYVAKLFNEEVHLLARADIADIKQLDGQVVNVGESGGIEEITARQIFSELGINVRETNLTHANAIIALEEGKIAATVLVAGKPSPLLASFEDSDGIKLLDVPYGEGMIEDFYPETLAHDDYPALIAKGRTADTVAVCAVLISFNWNDKNPRYARLEKFVDAFFSNFNSFLKPPRHPKWREVNFAAVLETWERSPIAQAWIDEAESASGSEISQSDFDTYIAQTAQAGSTALSDAERAQLFRAFLEWNKSRNSE